jgi:uncharacterized membrane protein YecN with MAPEG domain
MTDRTSDAVARAVWPWRGEDGETAVRRGLPRPVRALLNAIPAAAIALVLYFGYGAGVAAIAVGAVAGVVLLCGACIPRWYRAIERLQASLGRAVGLAITWILLAAVFVACFVPGRLLLVARRRDPLRRDAFRSARSAWFVRETDFDPARYERHY